VKGIHYTVSWLVRIVLGVVCKVNATDLRRLPKQGPAILVTNHINFLEVPLIYTHLMPRRLAALVKVENWNNPFFAFFGNLWMGIPISRGVVDRNAIATAKNALADGRILVIAPEGTRSGDGRLRKGNSGIVLFAADTGVPVFPAAHHGGESFWKRFKSFKRTDFKIRVGKPILVHTGGNSLGRETRKEITDEIMCRVAELLPDRLRGHYAGMMENRYCYTRPV
jgi:1-acyl-sn-glycerol-3-phosphate acyltransferase